MQCDDLIWNTISIGHCAYRFKSESQKLCRNKYNVTGLCNKSSCPLANSRYATIREHDGRIYLCIKVIERIRTPKKMWEKIKLNKNHSKALKQIDEELQYWPAPIVNKCKLKLTKTMQSLARTERLSLKDRPKMVIKNKKVERRLIKREMKAEISAKLETTVEKELLKRLKDGLYATEESNVQNQYNKALDEIAEDEMEILSEDADSDLGEFIPEFSISDTSEIGDMEDLGSYLDSNNDPECYSRSDYSSPKIRGSKNKHSFKKEQKKKEIEYEDELEVTEH